MNFITKILIQTIVSTIAMTPLIVLNEMNLFENSLTYLLLFVNTIVAAIVGIQTIKWIQNR